MSATKPPPAVSLLADGASASRGARLRELAALFLRLGVTAFGGPAAHIAMMEDEVVRRRGWMSHEVFLDMISACNLIPGPNSTEMAIHIGHRRAGFAGLVVAGACFIVPATAITIAVAWIYVSYRKLPAVGGVLYGVKPVIIAVMIQALWRLTAAAMRTRVVFGVTVLSTIAGLLGLNEIAILFAAGIVTVAVHLIFEQERSFGAGLKVSIGAIPVMPALAGTALAAPFSLGAMFLLFVKIGAVLFGSGYVLLAFLQADFVDRLHWLTQAQLLDAVAVGQFTPGPVFSTATFIGYLLGGTTGATVATAGIFLPAFCFVSLSGPLLPRLRNSAIASAFLDGVNAASFALMIVVTLQLGRAAVVDWSTLALALASAALLLRLRINSAWIVLAGGLLGALAMKLHG